MFLNVLTEYNSQMKVKTILFQVQNISDEKNPKSWEGFQRLGVIYSKVFIEYVLCVRVCVKFWE